ncbi:MAG: hypothetical protein AB1352_01500 [Patescibacteria group bacterium]
MGSIFYHANHTPARHTKTDYYEHTFKNPHRLESRRGVGSKFLYLGGGIIGGFLGICYWIFFSGSFSVTTIEVVNAHRINPGEVEHVVREQLGKKRLLVTPQEVSLFFVDAPRLEQVLLHSFPLKNVNVKPSLPHHLIVALDERSPRYLVRTAKEGAMYSVDEEGIVLGPAARGDGESLWIITSTNVVSTAIGDQMLPPGNLSFVNALDAASAKIHQGYRIKEVDMTRILLHDILVKTTEQWIIIMSDTYDPDSQLLNVERALTEMKEERRTIQYIDVRIPTKIFYK